MDKVDEYLALISELIDGIDRGDFEKDKSIPERYNYEYLKALFVFREELDGASDLYNQIYDRSIEEGLRYIREKRNAGEKIKVVFLTYSAAQWPAEEVYRFFEKDDSFEEYVVVAALMDRSRELRAESYFQTRDYFIKNGYNTIETYSIETDETKGWDEMGGIPDILVHLSSWNESLSPKLWVWKLPLRCLNIYVPYGIALVNNQQGFYMRDTIYNKDFSNIMWKIYTDSQPNKDAYSEYELLGGKNVENSGYVKMDSLIEGREFSASEKCGLWSIPGGEAKEKSYKKVIIAPHFSVYRQGVLWLSTFHHNLWFLLYLAKKYQDCVSFVFKPHPNLKAATVTNRVFESVEEYNRYLDMWDSLPNARVVEEGDYLNHFITSDGMIMDSGSFIGEYLYVQKPCLFLTREEQCFSELGQKCLDAYYKADGRAYEDIENFLQKVILTGNDPMADKRKRVFEEYLDYKRINGMMASEFVYRSICDGIGG